MSFSIKPLLAGLALLAIGANGQAGELTVSAAASLTNAFKEIAQEYETLHPTAKVQLNFGGSGALLQQLAKGAPVDVFASADQETMDLAMQQKLIDPATRQNFAHNVLVLIVPDDSTLKLTQLDDLTQASVEKVAIGNPASVPVGRYSQQALEAAKLWTAVKAKAINTQNVRQSLDYVARGEVEAGFVYATDANVMLDKVRVAFEVPLDVTISYPIAQAADSANAAEAQRFMAYVQSPPGQAVLATYGFKQP